MILFLYTTGYDNYLLRFYASLFGYVGSLLCEKPRCGIEPHIVTIFPTTLTRCCLPQALQRPGLVRPRIFATLSAGSCCVSILTPRDTVVSVTSQSHLAVTLGVGVHPSASFFTPDLEPGRRCFTADHIHCLGVVSSKLALIVSGEKCASLPFHLSPVFSLLRSKTRMVLLHPTWAKERLESLYSVLTTPFQSLGARIGSRPGLGTYLGYSVSLRFNREMGFILFVSGGEVAPPL